MKIILLTFTLLFGHLVFAQTNERWIAFWNEDSQLIGFKNPNGQVEIEPKFMGFTIAREFDNIIAVMEENNGKYEAYYLTKSGKKVGFDSLHIYDNGADCESNGFIRFRDKKTDKVGMFDKNGTIAIPAIYNELSRVHNGLIWALKGAKKKYWDSHKESGCNHYSWSGGQELLLSTDNRVLVDNFRYEGTVDFYSLTIREDPSMDSTKVSFKGINDQYYTLTDTKKSFFKWLNTELLKNLTSDKLLVSAMDSLIYWKSPDGWTTESTEEFVGRNFEFIHNKLQSTLTSKSDFFVSIDGLNPYMYTGNNYDQYFNTCGEAKREEFPVMDLIINNPADSDLTQDHFEFLKTAKGYRLISVSMSNEKTK